MQEAHKIAEVGEGSKDQRALIELDENGVLRAKTLSQQIYLADRFLASGMLPKNYESAGMVVTAWQFAAELGLPPITALRQISVINGTPSIWGDLPLAICRRHPDFEWVEEFLIDKDYQKISWANKNLHEPVFGAICLAKRKGQEVREGYFLMEDAKEARLIPSKPDSAWSKYPKDMLMYKARSRALKPTFGDALNGFAIAESDFDTMPRFDRQGQVVLDVESSAYEEPVEKKPTPIAIDRAASLAAEKQVADHVKKELTAKVETKIAELANLKVESVGIAKRLNMPWPLKYEALNQDQLIAVVDILTQYVAELRSV